MCLQWPREAVRERGGREKDNNINTEVTSLSLVTKKRKALSLILFIPPIICIISSLSLTLCGVGQ